MTEKSEFIATTVANPPTLNLDQLLDDLDDQVAQLATVVITTVNLYNSEIERIGERAVELDLVRTGQVVDGVAYLPGTSKAAHGLWISGERVPSQPDITSTITRATLAATWRAITEVRNSGVI